MPKLWILFVVSQCSKLFETSKFVSMAQRKITSTNNINRNQLINSCGTVYALIEKEIEDQKCDDRICQE
jgi:hypothetical protein